MSSQDLYEAEDEMDDEIDRLAVPKMTLEPGAAKKLPGAAALVAALHASWTRVVKLFNAGGLQGGGGAPTPAATSHAAVPTSPSVGKHGDGSATSAAATSGSHSIQGKASAGKGGLLHRLWGSQATPPAAGA